MVRRLRTKSLYQGDNNELGRLGRVLDGVLSEKPSNVPIENYLDNLASCLVGLAHPRTPASSDLSSPGSLMRADSEPTMEQLSSPSFSISNAGSGSQSPSATIPPISDMLAPLDSPFSESHELGEIAEVPISPGPSLGPSLFHEIRRTSRQQTTSSSMPRTSQSQNTSFSVHLRALVYKHKMMRGIFNFLFFTLRAALQLMYVEAVYSQIWLNLGYMHARILYHRILSIHPLLAHVLPLFILPFRSLHSATIFYLCILYIQEAISMATEVDPDVIVA